MKLEPINEEDDIYTIEAFRQELKYNSITNWDGSGVFATATEKAKLHMDPPDVDCSNFQPPFWATHVVWYNK